MSRIRILPEALASQVAAGEVVERPAAVIRELVENSLDAGASHVEVHVQRGGAALLRVTDNGMGMDREDSLLCIERHATSKIRTKEDLSAIHTLGFRGEAIPSIASVSRFRLTTRQEDSLAGSEIEIHGGRLLHVRDHGGAPGTSVEVRSLFYNVPARRKFLRSEQTEYLHVEQQFRLHAIANPQIAFTLVRDGQVVFHLPASDNLLVRISGLGGREMSDRLLPVRPLTHEGITVSGYIGSPGVSRSNKQMQLSFLNGRPVESATIAYALREGYHTALMKGQYPLTFLFITMPPEAFDINVHPAKKEVRFHQAYLIREAVVKAVGATLGSNSRISSGHLPPEATPPTASGSKPSTPDLLPETMLPVTSQGGSLFGSSGAAASFARLAGESDSNGIHVPPPSGTAGVGNTSFLASPSLAGDLAPQGTLSSSSHALEPPQDAASSLEREQPTSSSLPSSASFIKRGDFRILGVLHRLYVLMESSEGLVLMDQHAAHERVLFEQMLRAMETNGVPSQRLLLPLTWQMPPRDFDFLSRHLQTLQKLGIEAEPFGKNAFKIDALPAFLKTEDPLSLLRDVLDELSSASSKTSSWRLGEDLIATTVCRHAVKANDFLQVPELLKLLDDLLSCEMPYCCPHGRPTLVQMSLGELERKFGRRAPH